MMRSFARASCATLVLLGVLVAGRVNAYAGEEVTLTAADGVVVFGEIWRAKPGAPWILAFHQANSSHAEYAPLAPAFVSAGFSVLAIDQRSGGGLYGVNRTVEKLGASQSYDAAMADLEAALAWGKAEAAGAPVIVMGSSYSASLAILLAAKHADDVDGVVSFSPGEYLADRMAVHTAANKVSVPVYLTEGAGEEKDVTSIYRAVKAVPVIHYQPGSYGIHGASTLRQDKNPGGAAKNLAQVLAFLHTFLQPG